MAEPTADQKLLADALQQHSYDEWYRALLITAMEETKDAANAVAIADQVYAARPKDASVPQVDDADVLFAGSNRPEQGDHSQ